MIHKTFILSGVLQSLFLIFLLSSKRKNSKADILLMVWLGIVALQLLFYFDSLSNSPISPIFFQVLGFSLPLISSPILYFYIHSFSFNHKFQTLKTWIHFVPFSLLCLILLFLYALNPENIKFIKGLPIFGKDVPKFLQNGIVFQLALIPGFYTISSLVSLINYQKRLPENYSFTEKINLNWLKWVVLSLILLFISLFLLIKFGVNLGFVTYQNLFGVVGSVLSFYVFFIGYFGLKQTTNFINIAFEPNLESNLLTKQNYKNSGLSDEMVNQLFEKLLSHTVENKPYLDENLSLTSLAQQLEITPNQLSQIINQKTGSNFFNFINGYRVEEVKLKLKDPAFSHYSILAIGYDCGFQSKSSFNKVFKQMVGKTPIEFQKS